MRDSRIPGLAAGHLFLPDSLENCPHVPDKLCMRQKLAVLTGVMVSAVLTHGFVGSARRFDIAPPVTTYRGLFRDAILRTFQFWDRAHGWPPMSHVEEFAASFALGVYLVLPILGFMVYWSVSRQKLGWNVWRPLVVAVIAAFALRLVSRLLLPNPSEWYETIRASLVVLAMVWSMGGQHIARPSPGFSLVS